MKELRNLIIVTLFFAFGLTLTLTIPNKSFGSSEYVTIPLLTKKMHLGDSSGFTVLSRQFKNKHINISRAHIEMKLLDVVLTNERGLPFHPPDRGLYYDYVYINDFKVDYVNKYVRPIKPTPSNQTGVWQTVTIEIPVSYLKCGINTFRFEMGRHNRNYEDLDVKSVRIILTLMN